MTLTICIGHVCGNCFVLFPFGQLDYKELEGKALYSAFMEILLVSRTPYTKVQQMTIKGRKNVL
jgi:hypothetical protein